MSLVLPSLGLTEWLARVFVACGLEPGPAASGARVLVRADLRGIDTHGVVRVRPYVEKLRSGELNPRPALTFENRAGALFCNAERGLGPAVGMAAVEQAVARTQDAASVIVIVAGTGHLSALGIYALHAAEAGRLCLVMQSTPRVMALPGASAPAIGNNPLAFASPVTGGPPLVFDISAAAVTTGSLRRAARAGEPIAPGLAMDAHGQPTTDAVAAMRGMTMPIAGHKGLGLAMMVECLAGSLSGEHPATPGSPEGVGNPSHVGAFILTINPDLAAGRDTYDQHFGHWIAAYRDASAGEARYPGERAARVEAERRRTGIPLPPSTVEDLETVGRLTGVRFPP